MCVLAPILLNVIGCMNGGKDGDSRVAKDGLTGVFVEG